MMRATRILVIFAVLANAAPLDLSAWKYRKRIPVTAGAGVAIVNLDRDVFVAGEPDGHDVRVIRDGIEVPYEEEVLGQEEDHGLVLARIFDLSVVDGPAVQFTVDAGRTPHNTLHLTTPLKNFRQQVRIEASEDNRQWAMLRPDAAIFDFTQDTHQFSSLDVSFPTSTKPYLRVTILGWDKTASIGDVSLDHEVKRSAVRQVLATLTPPITEEASSKSTIATLDMGVAGLPVDYIVLDIASPQFQRAVNVEVSLDGKVWANLQEGVISRIHEDGFTEEKLTLMVPASRARYLRVRIFNRDDQPLEVRGARLEGLLRTIKFLHPTAGNYWLYYGNEGASTPGYDLGVLLSKGTHVRDPSVALGPAERNPESHPPIPPEKPWSEEHPAILYTVLGGAVLALGAATFRFAARLRT
jgi:Protein of unknown function (DUF3999)